MGVAANRRASGGKAVFSIPLGSYICYRKIVLKLSFVTDDLMLIATYCLMCQLIKNEWRINR
jgi:hypothetical protein